MRRILVDHARQHQAERQRDERLSSLDEALTIPGQKPISVWLSWIAPWMRSPLRIQKNAGWSSCVFLLVLNVEDTRKCLGVSPATVKREWAIAKAGYTRYVEKSGRMKTMIAGTSAERAICGHRSARRAPAGLHQERSA